MKPMHTRKILFATALLALVLASMSAQACSVCYGDADSAMSKGLTWGITVLLGVVVLVLGGITTFFVYIAKKSPTDKD
jgi:heme/copper-type cytochrome/quinol oxidase subunit 2